MKRAKKLISLIALAGMLGTAGGMVHADGIDIATYNEDTDTITVSGTIPSEQLEENISSSEIKTTDNTVVGTGWHGWYGTTILNGTDETDGFSYVATSGNKQKYTGIAQQIYNGLSKYELGTYRVSGKIKLTGLNEGVTRHLSVAIIKCFTGWNSPDSVKSNYADSVTISGINSTWQNFSVDIPVASYGLGADGTELEAFPQPGATNGANSCHVAFYVTDLADGKEENICIANFAVQKLTEVPVPDRIGITIADSTDTVVYANEIVPKSDRSYNVALQLADGVTASGLKARVQNTAGGYYEKSVVNVSGLDKITTVQNGKNTAITFDIFDFINTRDVSSLYIVAASYSSAESSLTGARAVPLDIESDTQITHTVTVDGTDGTDVVKLFILKDMTTLIPLCTVHSEMVTK